MQSTVSYFLIMKILKFQWVSLNSVIGLLGITWRWPWTSPVKCF